MACSKEAVSDERAYVEAEVEKANEGQHDRNLETGCSQLAESWACQNMPYQLIRHGSCGSQVCHRTRTSVIKKS